MGFDSGVEFPPHNLEIDGVKQSTNDLAFRDRFSGCIFPYESIAESQLNRQNRNQLIFKTVFPSWDNTARCGERALIIPNGTPANYEYWLARSIELTKNTHQDRESFVFINAWNEWAEGCHLEPDRKYGHQFLEATLRAASNSSALTDFPDKVVFNLKKREFITELSEIGSYHFSVLLRQIRSWISSQPKLKAILRIPVVFIRRLNLLEK